MWWRINNQRHDSDDDVVVDDSGVVMLFMMMMMMTYEDHTVWRRYVCMYGLVLRFFCWLFAKTKDFFEK